MPRVVVVGLDGGTWNLLEPWANQGELPALKSLMRGGVWGTLESTIPPLTGPAWASFATGRNPGKHGIFGFGRLEKDSARLYKVSDVSATTIPELLSRRELTSVVVGLPLSFPPSPRFRGVMVSDFLYHDKDIVPKSKRHYIGEYRFFPDLSLRSEEMLFSILDTAESQVQAAKQLFVGESWDLFFFYFGMTDTVLHFFWNDVHDRTQVGQEAKRVFRVADDFIQWLLDHMDSDSIILLVSDHGFAPCPFQLNLNNLLLEKGLLRTRMRTVDEADDQPLGRHVMELGQGAAERSRGTADRKRASAKRRKPAQRRTVDYAASTAFVVPGCVSPHIRTADTGARARIAEDLLQQLSALEYEGRRVFNDVMPRERAYSGPLAEFAPDLLLVPNRFFISAELGGELYEEYGPGSFHDPNAIFLAYGPGIGDSSVQPAGLHIYDVAPTILHVLGVPVPEDMDGRVLREVFVEASDLARRETVFQPAAARDEERRVSERLRKLLGLRKI